MRAALEDADRRSVKSTQTQYGEMPLSDLRVDTAPRRAAVALLMGPTIRPAYKEDLHSKRFERVLGLLHPFFPDYGDVNRLACELHLS
jgi:hypothetical protein